METSNQVKATHKRIYLTRHAEAEHNVASDYSIHDAPLTHRGREQAKALHGATKDNIQQTAELLVSSAMRRPLSTMVIGYPHLRKRLENESKVIVLPQLQECGDLPCDTGSPREHLESNPEFSGLDFSLVTEDWTSKAGFYASTDEALKARARWNRRWLRSRPEREIVVVSHGDCLRYITQGYNTHEPWANAEVREYRFALETEEDKEGDAWLVPTGVIAREGGAKPTSSEL
ncbi:phosphoglycerate mutase-like protein [Abortiporus biennis]|nr:phosphoglycerate mutase-like protein [Abortiporus biennis]